MSWLWKITSEGGRPIAYDYVAALLLCLIVWLAMPLLRDALKWVKSWRKNGDNDVKGGRK